MLWCNILFVYLCLKINGKQLFYYRHDIREEIQEGGEGVKRFNIFCSVIVVITVAIAIITLAQNITFRSSAAYTFYFNDTSVVSLVSSEYYNSQMSDFIAGFMNSFNPDEFQLEEDTGYDIEGIFDESDSDNMLAFKRALDISLVICLVSMVISAAIYNYFIKNNYKKVLRDRLKITSALVAVALIFEMIVLNTKWGIDMVYNLIGIVPVEDSAISKLLGEGFVGMVDVFVFCFTVVIYLVVLYATYVLTKPPRIFY